MPHTGTVLLIAILLFSINTEAMPTRQRIGELLELSNYKLLSEELRLAARKEPEDFAKNNYDYLLARIEEKRGDYASAAMFYHTSAERDPDLRPYALKHLAQIMRLSGNLAFERLFLNEIAFREPAGILRGPAADRLIRNYSESGDHDRVLDAIRNGIAGSSVETTAETPRELLLLIGKAYVGKNKTPEARDAFEEIIKSAPKPNQPDDFSLEAVKGLDRIEGGDLEAGIKTANLTDVEHKRRAGIYQFNRNFQLARAHYEAIVRNHESDTEIAEAMLQIARGYEQERNYSEALAWYQKILEQSPVDDFAAAAIYGVAGSYANLDDTPNAVAAYRKYIDENPKARNLERAHLNIMDAYRDGGDNSNALKWSSHVQNLFKGEMGEAVALFCDARIYISENKWDRAFAALSSLRKMKDLGGARIAGGTYRSEVDFLAAYMLEKRGRFKDAIDIYLSIPDGRGEYYGWRATERLRQLSISPKTKETVLSKIEELRNQRAKLHTDESRIAAQNISRLNGATSGKEIKSVYAGLSDYSVVPEFNSRNLPATNAAAGKFLKLHLYDEATPEIESSLRKNSGLEGESLSDFDDDTAYSLASYYAKAGFADRSVRFIEPKWKKVPPDYQIELIPRDQAVLLYPVPFRGELLKYGKKENLDARFLLAVMRQESRFQTDIKSRSAARGLMQFISGTSRKIASELKIETFSNDDLYDPDTAIRFGSRYLSNLFREFPGGNQAVAASYNGGEDRVARWLKRSKTDDPDRYVAEIVFAQTKDYVYRVMANYRMYTYLYDENLVLRSEENGG